MSAILSITSKEKKSHLQTKKHGTVSGLKKFLYKRKAKVIIKVVSYGWNWVETNFVGLIFSRSHYNYCQFSPSRIHLIYPLLVPPLSNGALQIVIILIIT